jgi:DNA-binding beta-propeller fold protein YncE
MAVFALSFTLVAAAQEGGSTAKADAAAKSPKAAPKAVQPQQPVIDMNRAYADEQFRPGVVAYQRGYFNDAVLQFEKALSYKSDDTLIKYWLGRAYYRSGLEANAVDQWQSIIDAGKATALLQTQTEIIRNRRGVFAEMAPPERFVQSGEYPGRAGGNLFFNRPSSIAPQGDGSCWIIAYGSNELVRVDLNGLAREHLRGPVGGFDRPFDALDLGPSGFYVSEFMADRIVRTSREGAVLASFGSKGMGDGQLLGPQYLAQGDGGYIYVTEYGNRRVSKFDADGNFIFSFGQATGDFEGFRAPTGIVEYKGRVYVADSFQKRLAVFDTSGNFISYLAEGFLAAPEGISVFSDDVLLIADTKGVKTLDLATETVRTLADFSKSSSRITRAVVGTNGDVLAVDFDQSRVVVLSDVTAMYSGFLVQTERIRSDAYPTVTLEVSVQDRFHRPIAGLDSRNFLVTEKGKDAAAYQFLGSADANTDSDVSILADDTLAMGKYRADLRKATMDLVAAHAGRGNIRFVTSGRDPAVIAENDPTGIAKAAASATFSQNSRFDLGLRLASASLVSADARRRAVVFVTQGSPNDKAFSRYSMSELAAYLANNGIRFYAITMNNAPPSAAITYLCAQTGGGVYYLYRPEGIAPVIEDIRTAKTGTYYMQYTASFPTDFGKRYLEVSVQAFVGKRSGRDDLGYFAPLQF